MESLRGRTALVTGASRGIGIHIARALAGEGMDLVLVARSAPGLESAAAELRARGARVTCLPADLARREEIDALAERAEAESGGIDVLVNNAGLELAYPYHRLAPEAIEEIVAVNLTAPMLLSRLLLPGMIRRGRGHIVNLSSLAGLVGTPYEEVYSATKHGLVGFSRSLRLTAAAEGYPVGVSVLCPAFVSETGMYAASSARSGAEAPFLIGTSPPEAVARAVVRAILRDEPEVVVSSRPVAPLLLVQTLAPRLAVRVTRRLGALELFRRWAEERVGADVAAASPTPDGREP